MHKLCLSLFRLDLDWKKVVLKHMVSIRNMGFSDTHINYEECFEAKLLPSITFPSIQKWLP